VGKILERRSGSLPVVISNFRGKIGCGAGAGLGCCSSGRRGCLLQVSCETAQTDRTGSFIPVLQEHVALNHAAAGPLKCPVNALRLCLVEKV
jgi:hypothetical protein